MSTNPSGLPGDDVSDEDLVRAWIAFQHAWDLTERGESAECKALLWAYERVCELTVKLPHQAWRTILLIWSMDRSESIRQILSASVVEELLGNHGSEIIPLVETEARRDATFAKMLSGCYRYTMTEEVWTRLQAVMDRRGWDGIPGE